MRLLKRTPSTTERLEKSLAILAMIDRRRESSGDPNLGSNIERMIIERELEELEREILLNPGPLTEQIARPPRRRRAAFNF
jgi:hypothetical protein